MRRQHLLALATLCIALAPLAAQAQSGTAVPPPPYRPGVGDLMTMTVQPRHLKLGLAGQEKNWTYAEYELHELEGAFKRLARLSPQWRDIALADLISATTKEPMEAVSQAIKAGDATKFSEAYARLTETCNACHQSSNVGMVVIQAPKMSPFPNQDFRAIKR